MALNVGNELAALRQMTARELRQRYEKLFGEACRSSHKAWLIKRIIWRMQANAEGDLTERARRRAEELANDADLRLKAPTPRKHVGSQKKSTSAPSLARHDPRIPLPGTRLVRRYKGERVEVTVLEQGFEYLGETFASLSAVAKAITGSHTSGFLFFRLTGKGAGR